MAVDGKIPQNFKERLHQLNLRISKCAWEFDVFTPESVKGALDSIAVWKGEGPAPEDFVQSTEKLKLEIEELFRKIEQENYEAKKELARAKARNKAAKKLRSEFELYLRLTG